MPDTAGETNVPIEDWTTGTLKVFQDQKIALLKEYIESLLTEKDKALVAALVAVKEENRKTEVQAEKRFDLLNELRQGVATKEQIDALEKIVDDLKDRLNRNDGKTQGSDITMGKLATAITVAVSILGLIIVGVNAAFKGGA